MTTAARNSLWILLVVFTLSLLAGGPRAHGQCEFTRGELGDTDVVVDLNDAVDLLGFLFLGTDGAAPECIDAADVNDNGFVEMSDYLYLVNFLLEGGPPPPAPYPDPGVDTTPPNVPDDRDPRFTFKIGSAFGFPSHTGLEIPLTISNEVGIEGFQMVLEYDGSLLRIDEFRLEDTVLAEFSERSYLLYQFFNRPDTSHATLAALLNYDPPLTFQTIPPNQDQLVALMVVGVQVTAPPQDTSFQFVDGIPVRSGVSDPERLAPLHNFVVLDTNVVRPQLDTEGGKVEIVTAFIRSDANQDRRVDISDSIFLLQHLFFGKAAPPCADAGDVNNDSKLDISDAIFLLNYLFTGSAQPPAPFPAPGLDPEINNPEVDPLGCDI